MVTKKLRDLILVACFTLVVAAAPALADFIEVGDVGGLPGTAQIITGGGPLNTITGAISAAGDADLFQIFISNPLAFSATTVGSAVFDTQLFLFDAAGLGVFANDDSFATWQSTLPAGDPNGPIAAGLYFLGISAFDLDPVSAGGLIFPSFPFGTVFGPTGPGGALPLSGYQSSGFNTGAYIINLTGAAPVTVPEPATLLLLGSGLLGLGFLRRRKMRLN